MVRFVNETDGFLRIRIDDSWVAPQAIYLRHNCEWQQIKSGRIMTDGKWRYIFVFSKDLQAA